MEIIEAHNESLVAALDEQAKLTGEIFSQLHSDAAGFWAGNSKNQIGSIIAFHRNYYDRIIKTTDKCMREGLKWVERSIDWTLATFNEHVKTF